MIKLNNLRKDYKSGNNTTTIVDISHLQFDKGAKVALVGASGSGKTTLLNLISGLVAADGGEVIIDKTDIYKLSEAQRDKFRANHVGYLFQSFHLLDGYSVLENVELGMLFSKGGSNRQQAITELRQFGLGEHLNHLPSQLSVGQQARVALARATVGRPQIILADEPTGALDSATSDEVMGLLFTQCEEYGTTLICATHDQQLAARFDHIINTTEIR
ncbi:MAG: ABC transporter ATP-binding protein [Planctomycetes bacterium]|nr:ABC transporter ATP-binding protein [Planctomycetota bacterium]